MIAGHAATFDPAPGSRRPPALRRAIEQALAQAGLEPGDIDVVFADAAGSRISTGPRRRRSRPSSGTAACR
ncbi:hypothetical protein ACFQ0B_09005 [Nonomuraea thailandensis]